MALSEIIVVGFDGVTSPYKQFKLAAWWDLLAEHAFGNFRTLLEAVTLNPAMGNYLSTAGNQKEDAKTGRLPDENYAREVMQLFTIGLYELNADGSVRTDASGKPLETYTQDMVTQLARVFTGYSLDVNPFEAGPAFVRRPMAFTASRHSTLAVSFLGTTIPANTPGPEALERALDTLFAHPNVGPFIGRQLIQRLVTSNPSPAYVSRVTAAFNDNGQGVRGDLSAVVKAVLLDVEARSAGGLTDPAFGKRFALGRDDAALLVIDVQERLGKAMQPEPYAALLKNVANLVEGAKVLGLPIFVTEQYPKGLGRTEGVLKERLPADVVPFEKVAFSCGAVKDVARALFQSGRRQVLVAGMEAHVCVFQTVRDLVAGGYQPFVARDAILSRTRDNLDVGLSLMKETGATLSSTEAVLFDLLGEAGTPEFKAIQGLVL